MVLGSLAGFLVNLLFDHSPMPMGLFLAGTSVIGGAIYAVTVRGAKAA